MHKEMLDVLRKAYSEGAVRAFHRISGSLQKSLGFSLDEIEAVKVSVDQNFKRKLGQRKA